MIARRRPWIVAVLGLVLGLGLPVPARATPAPAAAATPSTAVPPESLAQPPRPSLRDAGWWHWSYLIDWGLMLAVAGTGAGISKITPYERSFTLNTPRIDYASREETIPSWGLIPISALPLVVFGIAQASGPSGHDFHHATLGLGEALAVTLVLSSTLKVSIGRLRPDFLDRCQLVNLECTGDPDEIRTGRRSFPSGHASLSFAAGTYLSLYLWGKLSPLDGLHWLWKIPALVLPLAGATFVAWTRVRDHRHHWEDVLAGGLLGMGSAALGYVLNFHPPWSRNAGKPRRRKQVTVVPVVGSDRIGLAVQGGF